MSNPLIVTDKSPKHLLAIQRYVMNSQRYVGGVDTTIWGGDLAPGGYIISGGSRNGQVLGPGDYTSATTAEGVTLTLTTALNDGRVLLYPAITGYTVTKLSGTVWRAERLVTLRVVGGWLDARRPSVSTRSNACLRSDEFNVSPWFLQNLSGATSALTSNYGVAPDGSNTATRFVANVSASGNLAQIVQIVPTVNGLGYTTSIWAKSLGSSVNVKIFGIGGAQKTVNIGTQWTRFTAYEVANPLYSPTSSPNRAIRVEYGSTSSSVDLLIWRSNVSDYDGFDVKTISSVVNQPDAVLGAVQYDGSRTLELTQPVDGIEWDDAPNGWVATRIDSTHYLLHYIGDLKEPELIEADLNAVIDANEMLELRGELTVYNNLTINGKLYITQELGF